MFEFVAVIKDDRVCRLGGESLWSGTDDEGRPYDGLFLFQMEGEEPAGTGAVEGVEGRVVGGENSLTGFVCRGEGGRGEGGREGDDVFGVTFEGSGETAGDVGIGDVGVGGVGGGGRGGGGGALSQSWVSGF